MVSDCKRQAYHSNFSPNIFKGYSEIGSKIVVICNRSRKDFKVVKSLQLLKKLLTKIANIARKRIFNKEDDSKKKAILASSVYELSIMQVNAVSK